MTKEAMKAAVETPLIEQLRSVPADAVLKIDTPNALGCMDTSSIPVGALCHLAASALLRAALEGGEEPVYWQWRRLPGDWTLDYTFAYEVKATTPDSEVRPLYASPIAADTLRDAERLEAATQRAREALPEFRQQDDYLLAHGASLMSDDSHEIIHTDTLAKIVRAALHPKESSK